MIYLIFGLLQILLLLILPLLLLLSQSPHLFFIAYLSHFMPSITSSYISLLSFSIHRLILLVTSLGLLKIVILHLPNTKFIFNIVIGKTLTQISLRHVLSIGDRVLLLSMCSLCSLGLPGRL